METPTLNQFLSEVARVFRNRNGEEMQKILLIEPPFTDTYNSMIAEIREVFPAGYEEDLEWTCSENLPEARDGDEDGATWGAFIKFMAQYFAFIRDINVEDLLETNNQLSELLQKSNVALGHPTFGIVMLPTVITYSKMLTRLAIGLERQPELMANANLTLEQITDDGEQLTLPERAANIIRNALVTCLNDRSGGPTGILDGKPAGKKTGIYKIANLCLKILFECKKTSSAQQIINNIHKSSPRLSAYPAAERVTYLYYLGRFHFDMSHFYRAQLCLQAAYDESPRYFQCLKQRRLILIYLITSNIILGRFPNENVYQKPEAYGLRERFHPLCQSIATGDLATFRQLTDFDHEHADWFVKRCIFLQLGNLCEVLVWRSLIRKQFMIGPYQQYDKDSKRAPTIKLDDLTRGFVYLEKRALNENPSLLASAKYVHPDFDGITNSNSQDNNLLLPDTDEIEGIVMSLIEQGLLNGFVSHRLKRFAIQGAKTKDPMEAGFPVIFQVIKDRMEAEESGVPGWKKDDAPVDEGRVVRLSGLKAIGGDDD
jgi:tetratricopeptide (TPR) repeat protein